uniref:Beta-1,4-N-acetylgalactosaminyltransferase n=1 Tax=Glossina morsitans morsitans TaxID=37546 RepID=D3TQ83_GLOMM
MYIRIYQRKYHLVEITTKFTCALALIYICLPHRFASHYNYLSLKQIENALVSQVTHNITLQHLEECSYGDILTENRYMYGAQYREEILRSEEILAGGEYYPEKCRARFSTAIIVPYRQREEQLHSFLIYMHNYLRHQRIHYRIFLVEQYDQKPFNRAKLFNIGSNIAAEYGFPCLIFSDVDLLPLNLGSLYVCTQLPRHMCSALDMWRFNLPYSGLFGGVVSIRTEQFRAVNGMSNLYEGWGGEDDDFYERLQARNIDICRFAPAFSEFTMLRHKAEEKNENRVALLRAGVLRHKMDGLNSLMYDEKERRIHSLFTHILAET